MKPHLKIERVFLFVILSLLLTSTKAQTTLFTEDWESAAIGTTPPTGWATEVINGTNLTNFVASGSMPYTTPYSGSRMTEFQSFNGPIGYANRLKRTTAVSTAGYPHVAIDFEWFTDSAYLYVDDRVDIQWSVNGTTWTTAATIYRFSPIRAWVLESVGLPAGAGNQATLYIAFLFTSAYGENCNLDLVHIKGYSSTPPAPMVLTTHATNITTYSATLNGFVNPNGYSSTGYFEYGPTTSYGTVFFFDGSVTGSSLVSKSVDIFGLTTNTTYHFRLVAFNAGGTSLGNDSVFTTVNYGPPLVITNGATSITGTTAFLNGQVNANGYSTSVTFQYGLTTSYGSTLAYGNVYGTSLTNVSIQATGLTPNTTYHFRCTGSNAYGTTYGNDMTFTTASSGYPPTVITTAANNINTTIATLNGLVNANGTTTTVTFQYGLTTSYGSTGNSTPVSGNTLTPVSYTAFYLDPGTQYHYRCVGVNSFGTTYGNDTVFSTLPAAPTVVTGPATNIGLTTATLTGTADANGTSTTVTFEYGLTSSYGSTVAGVPNTVNGSTPQRITANLTGLTSATVYHFLIKGTNSLGVTYGYDTTFTTLNPAVNPPTVTTTQANSISAHQAVLGGIVNANGSATTTHFEYGTTTAYGSTIPAGNVYGNTNTPISAIAYSLTQGTLYHFRAAGSNAGGISYGADSTFTTSDSVTPCHALYTYNPQLTDLLTVHFYDLSIGNIVSSQWSFGDPSSGTGNFSTLQNPTHYFSTSGTYNVCLTIQGIDSLCHDTYCYHVAVDTTVMLHVWGTVTDSVSHYPVPYHPIIIDNDTMNGSNYPHHRIVYTDVNGVYNDTISIPPSEITWRFIIRTYDGNHNQYALWTGYAGGPPEMHHDFEIYTCPNSGCNAHFIAYPDSTNPLTYHFIDQSGGNITSWYWSFGDGTHSFDRNPTHTFLHLGEVHHVCHTVVDSVNSCCDVYCMDIVPGYSGCQANFYFYSDTTGTNHTVQFFDSSTGNPMGWSWNFGDPSSGPNNTTYLQNPSHTFTSTGSFNICLTITGDSCSSTYCRIIIIPDSVNYHQLYGQVFAGNFPLQLGLAIIFSVDTSQTYLPYVNVSVIDSNGVYYFTQVPDGNYVINAIPEIPSGYIPTYYGDVITWELATPILLGTANNPYNIHLVEAGTYSPGGGSVSGHIYTGKTANNLIDKITMTLFDVNKHPIGFSRVSTVGEFDFSSLDYGTYYLHPQLTGVTCDTVMIQITPDKPHVDVVMTFTGSQILGTGNIKVKSESVTVYPNPVTDQLKISINLQSSTDIKIVVSTIAGQTLFTTTRSVGSGQSTFSIPFSGFTEGMYIVKINSEDGINVVKRVVKSR